MHAARLEKSARLQRVAALLSDGREYSTLDIVIGASVCAVNSCIAELRENGFRIACRRVGDVWYYRMEGNDGMA
jgi:biotin operon repressor